MDALVHKLQSKLNLNTLQQIVICNNEIQKVNDQKKE